MKCWICLDAFGSDGVEYDGGGLGGGLGGGAGGSNALWSRTHPSTGSERSHGARAVAMISRGLPLHV